MAGIALTAQRIRLAVDTSRPFSTSTADAITGLQIMLPSGSALNFEFLFYFQALLDANLVDLTQYSGIYVALCANADPHSGTIYYEEEVTSGSFNVGATVESWSAAGAGGSSAHIQLFVPSASNVVPPANTNYWIVVYAVSTDLAADDILLFAAKINTQDSGIPSVPGANAGSPTKVGTKLSFVCADTLTRDLTIAKTPAGSWAPSVNQAGYNGPGQASFSLECADNLYRDISLVLDSGVWVPAINQNGHS